MIPHPLAYIGIHISWYGNTLPLVEDSIMIPSLPTYGDMLHYILYIAGKNLQVNDFKSY